MTAHPRCGHVPIGIQSPGTCRLPPFVDSPPYCSGTSPSGIQSPGRAGYPPSARGRTTSWRDRCHLPAGTGPGRESLALGVPPAQRALDNVRAVLDAAAVTLHRSPRALTACASTSRSSLPVCWRSRRARRPALARYSRAIAFGPWLREGRLSTPKRSRRRASPTDQAWRPGAPTPDPAPGRHPPPSRARRSTGRSKGQPYANRQLDVYFAAGDSYPSAGP